MHSNQGDIRFAKVSSRDLHNFIGSANKKVIIAKPGYLISEVDLLLELINRKEIACTVYIDADENAIRWGFGENDSLLKLHENITNLNLKTAERIRLSIVIVDDQALVFVPVALSWEKEPEEINYPNGLLCSAQIAQSFIDQLEKPTELSEKERKVIPFPGCSIPQKTKEKVSTELKGTIEKLEKNPPIDPAKLRRITIYRNNYKLLKVELRGVNVRSKTVNLNPINSLFPNANERLRASWKAFSKEDTEKIWQLRRFTEEIAEIIENHTLNVGRFGYLIKAQDLTKFRKRIEDEKGDLLSALKAKTEEEVQNANKKYIYQENKQAKLFTQAEDNTSDNVKTLGSLLDGSRNSLKKYFMHFIASNPEAKKTLLEQNRAVMKMVEQGHIQGDRAMEGILDELISHRLRFPNPKELLDSVDVIIDAYDASDELLYENEEFKRCLQALKTSQNEEDQIKIRKFSDAFETQIEA